MFPCTLVAEEIFPNQYIGVQDLDLELYKIGDNNIICSSHTESLYRNGKWSIIRIHIPYYSCITVYLFLNRTDPFIGFAECRSIWYILYYPLRHTIPFLSWRLATIFYVPCYPVYQYHVGYPIKKTRTAKPKKRTDIKHHV